MDAEVPSARVYEQHLPLLCNFLAFSLYDYSGKMKKKNKYFQQVLLQNSHLQHQEPHFLISVVTNFSNLDFSHIWYGVLFMELVELCSASSLCIMAHSWHVLQLITGHATLCYFQKLPSLRMGQAPHDSSPGTLGGCVSEIHRYAVLPFQQYYYQIK